MKQSFRIFIYRKENDDIVIVSLPQSTTLSKGSLSLFLRFQACSINVICCFKIQYMEYLKLL